MHYFNCQFCGQQSSEESDDPEDNETFDVRGCRLCVPPLEVGILVKYGSATRAPGDAVYADQYLERDKVYTIAGIKRHQHASYVRLRETGNREFHFGLFVPRTFEKASAT